MKKLTKKEPPSLKGLGASKKEVAKLAKLQEENSIINEELLFEIRTHILYMKNTLETLMEVCSAIEDFIVETYYVIEEIEEKIIKKS